MINLCLDVLQDLIDKGEIQKDDPIIDETKERLIEMLVEWFPGRLDIAQYVEKQFDERLEWPS